MSDFFGVNFCFMSCQIGWWGQCPSIIFALVSRPVEQLNVNFDKFVSQMFDNNLHINGFFFLL